MKAIAAAVSETRGVLTARDRERFAAFEKRIESNCREVVDLMQTIRDERLYRETHDTFEDYCRERWSKTARAINHSIQCEQVAQAIATEMGKTFPKLSHGAANEVADLPPKEAAKIVAKAAENGQKPTAANVRQAREETVGPKASAVSRIFDGKGDGRKVTGGTAFNVDELGETGKPQPEAGPSPTVMQDSLRREVPKRLNAAASTAAALEAIGRRLDPIRGDVEKIAQGEGGEWLEMAEVNRLSRELKTAITHARYWTSCPRCGGDGCERCSKTGYLPLNMRGRLSDDDKAILGIER